jgi:hypothetical protein
MSYKKLSNCRASNSNHLIPVVNLGEQALTGVFPSNKDQKITKGPLELVICPDSGLLQLNHSYDMNEMYGDNYGYRSGLNSSMVSHLNSKIYSLEVFSNLSVSDTVLDIGSNDCTTLKAYSVEGLNKIGIDPTGSKFKEFYDDDISLVPEFFSKKAFQQASKTKATIVTSIAMFYDLESPISFASDVSDCLSDDGIWHFEQSYMPSMLRMNSYDTICHEHLEYYSLESVMKILDQVDLKIVDVRMNSINGGSFAITACKKRCNKYTINSPVIDWLLEQENLMNLSSPQPYRDFEDRIFRHRADLRRLICNLVASGKTVLGYGASTKGNVVLQFCRFTQNEITAIADVNPDKFGKVTPGSNIPILSEQDAREMNPDYYLLLPWHFKDGILEREKDYLRKGGKMIIPFPEIEII